MAVEVGQQAPDFTLYDMDGKERSLGEFKGQHVVLAFFPGVFTGVCTTEMCTFRDRLGHFDSLTAQVLGISVDARLAQKAFSDQNNLNFPILSDFQRKAVGLYGVELPNFSGMEGYVAAQRSVFVVDKAGVVQFKWIAPNTGVDHDYDQVKDAVSKL